MVSLLILFTAFRLAITVDPTIHAKYESSSRQDFINYFNDQGFTWNITHYDFLENINFNCSYLDGDEKYPTIAHEFIGDLPKKLDAREKWTHCPSIRKIYRQGHCGSCWAFAVASTASDRLCIGTGKTIDLSKQDFSCCTNCFSSGVCEGGNPAKAFSFWIETGLVSDECRPYHIPELKAGNGCKSACNNKAKYKKDKHFGLEMYSIPPVEDTIKLELFNNGPIEGILLVYDDFIQYSNGIYDHTFGEYRGVHSVRIIGYGEENNVPYWLVANSWGEEWGEKGFIRMKRFTKNVYLENYLHTAKAK